MCAYPRNENGDAQLEGNKKGKANQKRESSCGEGGERKVKGGGGGIGRRNKINDDTRRGRGIKLKD